MYIYIYSHIRIHPTSICPHAQQVCVTAADQIEGFRFAQLIK
jgi:hypothetical protein